MRIWVPPSQPASVPSAGWDGDPQIRIWRDPGYTTSSKPRAYKHSDTHPPSIYRDSKVFKTFHDKHSDTHTRRPSIYRGSKLFKMLSLRRASPETLINWRNATPWHPTRTMDVAVANAPLFPFGQSYWDYLPDLVQTKILKMAHKQLWKSVNAQIRELFSSPICKRHFDDRDELEYHWSLYFHPVDEER